MQACVEANKLVDDTEFIIPNPKGIKPKQNRPRSNASTPQKRKKSTSTPASAARTSDKTLSRSPTPPLDQQPRRTFSEEDSAYMLRYLRVALRRNPEETIPVLAVKLASKVSLIAGDSYFSISNTFNLR